MNEPSVEVIILNLNGTDDTVRCLTSLRHTRYGNFKVTLVDQHSSDGSAELVERDFNWVNLIRNSENNGFCKGNNQILRGSRAKYCVLLNNDTEPDPHWLARLVEIAEHNPHVAALQPKILSMRDRQRFEYAGAAGGFIDIYGYPLCRGRVFDQVEEDHGQYDDAREIFWSCGVAMLLRREVLEKIGYLDELMFSYAEETGLCWRMNVAGYKLRFVPQSVVYHLGSGTWKKKEYHFKKEYLTHRNHWIIIFKNYSPATWWRIVPVKALLELLALANFLFANPTKAAAIVKANLWILFHPFFLLKQNREIARLRKVPDTEIMAHMINTSIALHYFVWKKRTRFRDFIPFIKAYYR